MVIKYLYIFFLLSPDADSIPPTGADPYTIAPGARDTFTVDAYCPTEGTGYIIIKVFVAGNPSQFVIDTFNVHRSTSGIIKLSSLVSGFKLEQNYPNPFNPSTIINFSLPKAGLTSLIVYDLTGREVVKLLNGINLHEGNYSFDFNAENFNLTSGVYIYKLNTSDYVSVKKMMLIK